MCIYAYYIYIYTDIYTYTYIPIYPCMYMRMYVYMCVYMYIYLSIYLPIYLSIYHLIYLFIYLSVYLSVCLSIYLSIYLYNLSLSLYLSIYLSVCLSIYLSISLSFSRKTQEYIPIPICWNPANPESGRPTFYVALGKKDCEKIRHGCSPHIAMLPGSQCKILTITYDISLYIIRIVELFQLFPSRKLVNVWARFPDLDSFHSCWLFFVHQYVP